MTKRSRTRLFPKFRLSFLSLKISFVLLALGIFLHYTDRLFAAERVFLEAESFKTLGGWVVDPHSMSQIGSSYLMAHGYGQPVADAETELELATKGTYTIWVRTRDWTASWHRGTPAGKFQILVNQHPLPETLGTNGVNWDWQKAGSVTLTAGKNKIALHDLTGFNGRCDAIFLTTDPKEIPANEKEKLAIFRKKMTGVELRDCRERFDLIVVGGGISGICAATAAARSGSRVLLLQDREVLGGCNSSEIRVGLGGHINIAPFPKLGEVVREIQPIYGSGGTWPAEYYEDGRKEILFRIPNCGCKLMFREHVYGIEMDPNDPKKIRAVLSRNTHTGAETRFFAPLFVDATGDAVLARPAGCEIMYGREARSRFNEINAPEKADRQVMGHSVLWYARKQEEPVAFPNIDWAIPFDESKVYYIRGGDWEQEAGQYRDMTHETEYIRDFGLLSIYSNWSYIKNHSKRKAEFANDRIDWVSPIGGKRESCRVVGDYVLTQNDLEGQKALHDQTAAITWDIDLHFPDPDNVAKFGEPFRSCAYHRGFGAPYPVPYRCLYARDCKNLFLAGRHISTSHVAFAAVRVMRTLGMLGEVVGMAASICREENALPRDVYEKFFDRLVTAMEKGVLPLPTYHAYNSELVEKYHFKELGMINISDSPTPNLSERVKKAIRELGMKHRREHPELRLQNNLPTMKINGIFNFNEKNRPENNLELDGGSLVFFAPNSNSKVGTMENASDQMRSIDLFQNIRLNGKINTIAVENDTVRLGGVLHGTEGTFVKSGKGTLVLDSGLAFSNTILIKEGTLQLNAQSSKTKKIEIAPDAVLFCNARNALGIYAQEKTFPDELLVRGELRGPANQHINLGRITLESGRITASGGRGSEILGNFCLAGKVTARGKNVILAPRISFRADASTVDGASGLFDLPLSDDLLTIDSAIDSFHGSAVLRKEGAGTLILNGSFESDLPIEVRAGTLQLRTSARIKKMTVSGSLFLCNGRQKIFGDLIVHPGGRIVVDPNALADSTPSNPLVSVEGKIVGVPEIEFINCAVTKKIDPEQVSLFGKPLSEKEKSNLKKILSSFSKK